MDKAAAAAVAATAVVLRADAPVRRSVLRDDATAVGTRPSSASWGERFLLPRQVSPITEVDEEEDEEEEGEGAAMERVVEIEARA
jgi:hypothetical protein